MTEQIVVYDDNGILLCCKQWWIAWFLYELERPPRTDAEQNELNQENVIHRKWNNQIQLITNNRRAIIQENPEGFIRKNSINNKGKNCGSRNAEEKHMIDHIVEWGYDWACWL